MMAALLLKRRHPSRQVILLEAAAQPGGNYRCVDLGPQGRFDQGMRMFYETGIPEFDALIHGILPAQDWHVMRGNEKDIAGIYWKGGLQVHTPYLDLRRLEPDAFAACKREVLAAAEADKPADTAYALAYLQGRFGPMVAGMLGEVLEKLYGAAAQQLDVIACKQPAMDRVVLFDSETMQGLLGDAALRARVAWPEQLTLPVMRPFNQAALYPRRYGMDAVIARLQAQLEDAGVALRLGDSIQYIEQAQGRIRTIRTKSAQIDAPAQLLWTGGLPVLAKLLGLAVPPPPAMPQTALAYVLLPQPPEAMQRLYHFYCFDKGLHSFRVTNHANYCPDAKHAAGYPLCVELWNVPPGVEPGALAVKELSAMGIATEGAVVAGVAHTPNLHAMCGLEAVQGMRKLREGVQALAVENLELAGVAAVEGLLLLYEVWRDMYRRLEKLS